MNQGHFLSVLLLYAVIINSGFAQLFLSKQIRKIGQQVFPNLFRNLRLEPPKMGEGAGFFFSESSDAFHF